MIWVHSFVYLLLILSFLHKTAEAKNPEQENPPSSLLIPVSQTTKSLNTQKANQTEISSSTPFMLGPLSQTECHPNPSRNSSDKPQYIVGYGSLMETASKYRTAPNTGPSIPVIVKGFRREWNAQGASIGASTSYLGVVQDPKSSFNAVVFTLPNSSSLLTTLHNYDERESWYCRYKIRSENIISLLETNGTSSSSALTLENGDFWIYINKPEFTKVPTRKYPIVQSYVDIFIAGCLELELKFALKNFTDFCIGSTAAWSKEWVNDRIYPRRPFIFQPKAAEIDAALARNIPAFFKQIILND